MSFSFTVSAYIQAQYGVVELSLLLQVDGNLFGLQNPGSLSRMKMVGVGKKAKDKLFMTDDII